MNKIIILTVFLILFQFCAHSQTTITKWKDDKKGAVSITFDDGNRNQFKYALPILERLQLPATFYIITGPIIGSQYPGKFIGRNVNDIIKETATIPTDSTNYFERASAAKYLNRIGADAYYDKSAIAFEDGKIDKAYKIMDTLYQKARDGSFKTGIEYSDEVAQEMGLSWDSIKVYASKGYEFASHTVTHTHLAVLDTANINYELYKSKDDIKNHLGSAYTFDAEIPFGIEHPRALKYGFPAYAALRNMMTDSFLFEINRGYKTQPGSSNKAYVQWQRGPLSKTTLAQMKSYIDTTLAHNNIWLVLVFHGINGLGWEALPDTMLETYFQYIKQNENNLWITTFKDAGKYMRERMHTNIKEFENNTVISVQLTQTIDKNVYDVPLTLKTYVPANWKYVIATQANFKQRLKPIEDKKGHYVLYDATPAAGEIKLSAH
ncbi:MAG TPA: polysaccharide deacetylase family protein [Parafilimonas sp.]|nr:polysaccharide deacetylase family protein [Parafilimonas sp.]